MKNYFFFSLLFFSYFLTSCQTPLPIAPGPAFNLLAPFPGSFSFGSYGSGNGQFIDGEGIAIDTNNGFIYTTDGNNRVQKFDMKGNYVNGWTNGLNIPNFIALDLNGNVYVSNWGNDTIVKYDSTGNILRQSGSGPSTFNGQFDRPGGIAADQYGYIFVADSNNGRIQKFDSNLNYVSKWGSLGCGNGQLNYPQQIAVNNGYVYVADNQNQRIEKFDSNGIYTFQIGICGQMGIGNGQFKFPTGLAVDTNGNIYVSDVNNLVQKFDANGNFVSQWGGFGDPRCLSMDSKNNIYVMGGIGNRVVVAFPYDFSGLNVLGVFPNTVQRGQKANIEFQLTNTLSFSIVIRDSNETLITQYQGQGVAGDNILQWNMSVGGKSVSAGVYTVQFQSGDVQKTANLSYLP